MSFESGSIGFRMFYLRGAFGADATAGFAAAAAPPLRTLGVDLLNGWTGGRHLLDVPITEKNATCGGYGRLHLIEAQRKIPPALFRARCRMEEIAWMTSESRDFVPRKVRGEIRDRVQEELLPDMPPQLRGQQVIVAPDAGWVFSSGLGDRQADLLRVQFLKACGAELVDVRPATAAAQRRRVDVREWRRVSFAPDVAADAVNDSPGQDFLTWLWFNAEARGGRFRSAAGEEYGLAIEGPLVFAMEGEGAHETVLRKGSPLLSAEARTCLLSGKKLQRAKLLLARGDQLWSVGLDADAWVFRGLRLPENEEKILDPVARFQDRMTGIRLFLDLFFDLFDRFVAEREDPAVWKKTLHEVFAWAAGRAGRN